MTVRPELARPLGLSLVALVFVASVLPPETSGVSLAGCALLVALATAIATTMRRVPAGAWGLVAAVSCLALISRFGVSPGDSIQPAAAAVVAIAAYVAASAVADAGLLERLGLTLATAGAAVGARGVYEAVWGLDRLAAAVRDHASAVPDAAAIAGRLEQGRAYAGFPTPAAAGGFLVLALCATVGFALERSGRPRALFVAAAAVQGAGLLSTRSLTAAAGLLVAVAIALFASRSRRLAGAAAALVLAIALVGALRAGQVFSSSTDDSPWRLRGGNVRIGLAIADAHPLLGVGPGGYAGEFPRYRLSGDNESRHAHCLPVELAAELGWAPGLVATAIFFVVFLGPLVTGLAARSKLEQGLAIGLAAFAFHNLADFTAFLPSVLWTACALRGAMSRASGEQVAAGLTPRLAWSGCVLVAAALLVCAGMSADAREKCREAVMLGEDQTAAESADRAVRWAPFSADAALLRAQARLNATPPGESLSDAGDDADRAVVLSPSRAAAREVRARIRARGGDVPGAYADLAAAVALHPSRDDYAKRRAEAAAALPRRPDADAPR